MGAGTRRHFQSIQGGAIQLATGSAAADRTDCRIRLPIIMEPAAARRHVPALGRQQRLRRGTQPECLPGCRRDPGHHRSCPAQARARLDLDLAPPAYPYPIDQVEAQRGHELYNRYCLDCHADGRFKDGIVEGKFVGTVEPIEKIGTDRYRLDSYTFDFAANQYTLYPDSRYRFTHFRKTQGYANQPLDGIWLRAPYLHNGSVPTLRALLDRPEDRPARFYRGYDVYDPEHVGFVSDVAGENATRYFLYDTSLPGNGNAGHRYGLDLAPEDKDAIVEYMKTF